MGGMPTTHLDLAEAAWRWVLDQVRYDEGGVWIPVTPDDTDPSWDRDGIHSGVGGLVLGLTAVSSVRPWTDEESALAQAVGDRIRSRTADESVANWFDGLAGHVAVLALLRQPGIDDCVERLLGMGP